MDNSVFCLWEQKTRLRKTIHLKMYLPIGGQFQIEMIPFHVGKMVLDEKLYVIEKPSGTVGAVFTI